MAPRVRIPGSLLVFLRKPFEEEWPSGLWQLLGKQPSRESGSVGSNPISSALITETLSEQNAKPRPIKLR